MTNEPKRYRWIHVGRDEYRLGEDLLHEFARVLVVEREAAEKQAVQDHAQAPHVCRRVSPAKRSERIAGSRYIGAK